MQKYFYEIGSLRGKYIYKKKKQIAKFKGIPFHELW